MAEQEGIIHFAYDLQPSDTTIVDETLFAQLQAWRSILKKLELLGQDSERYHGLGFGNLSVRDPERPNEFIITASQTGGRESLSQRELVRITSFNLERFWADVRGALPPSSESMTHAMVYAADRRIDWVFHCHSPHIWQQTQALALPCTPSAVPYGSPDMATAVTELFSRYHSRPLVFASLGHTDGVFACGSSARDCGGLLVTYLAKALAMAPASTDNKSD